MPLPLKLQRCVVFFGIAVDRSQSLPQERSKYGGTGFVVSLPFANGRFAHNYLCTNAHVATKLESRPTAFVRVNRTGSGSESIWLDGQLWARHPRSEVDIAILRPNITKFPKWRALDIDAVSVDEFIPEQLLDNKILGVGDPIHVSGLLSRTPGATRNMPLVRSGNLAALASEPVLVRENVYEPVHLGIIQSIGGMSGSPTFIEYRPLPYATTIDPNKPWGYLLGINAGHYISTVDPLEDENANAGVNIIFPVKLLWELLMMPEIVRERELFEAALQEAYPEAF